MKTILNIISQYPSLSKALKWIIFTNESNNAPYHNLNHLLTVTRHCWNAVEYDNDGYDLREELLMAALFHDYNHSMGKFKDDVNVSVAKKQLAIFIINNHIDLKLDKMLEIIDATQYPYIIPTEDLNKYQQIIRDADLCQIYEYDWLKQNIFGLSQEMGIGVIDLIMGQKVFLESIKPITPYGKFMHKTHFKNVMDEMDILQNIIK
jgi:hypothetical protein